MKFGIFYEMQIPRPWSERSEYQVLQDALGQIELADRLGFDYAWAVEHHFLEEYSHCSAPEVFLGAASQRTQADPAGSRHRPAPHQPPDPRGRAGVDARSAHRRARGAGARRGSGPGRAAPVQPARARQARGVGGSRPGAGARVHPQLVGVARPVLRLRRPQRGAQAVPEAAPAALGGVLEHPDHRQRRTLGDGRARLPVRLARGRARVGAPLLHGADAESRQARRLSGQSQHRHGQRLHVRPDRCARRWRRPRAGRSSCSA